MYSLIGPFFGGRPRPAIFTKTDEETPTPLANASVSPLSLSLSLSALSKEPGFDDKREARKSFEKFLFFFFLTQDCLNPMILESTYFFQRKGKKGYERGGGFPIANNDTIRVNPRARRT